MSLVLFALLIFVANTIQTISGFAGAALVMPFAMLLVGRQTAAAEKNLLGLFICVFLALKDRKLVQWKQLWRIFAMMGSGVLVGIAIEQYLNFSLLQKFYGVFILVSVAVLALRKSKARFPFVVDFLLLFCAGVIQSIFVSGGPMLVIYTMNKIEDKGQFRATMNAAWIPINILVMASHLRLGLYTPSFFGMFAVLFPAMVAGIFAGYKIYNRVSPKAFLYFAYVLLACIGLYMVLS